MLILVLQTMSFQVQGHYHLWNHFISSENKTGYILRFQVAFFFFLPCWFSYYTDNNSSSLQAWSLLVQSFLIQALLGLQAPQKRLKRLCDGCYFLDGVVSPPFCEPLHTTSLQTGRHTIWRILALLSLMAKCAQNTVLGQFLAGILNLASVIYHVPRTS